MKKLSKKKRKKLKVEEERKEVAKAKMGVPYSRHRKWTCYHYSERYSFYKKEYWHMLERKRCFTGQPICVKHHHSNKHYRSDIVEIGGKYICLGCKQEFSKQQYETMLNFIEKKNKRLTGNTVLPEGIEPVKYYYTGPNEKVVIKPVCD